MKLDKYDTITADNWKIQAHRIRSPKIFNRKYSTPVLVAHGTMGSSAGYMIDTRSESLAYVLADNGYDVWLANFRGTQFSFMKVTSSGTPYEATGKELYDTTWQFMAEYDMPAFLDLILKETRQDKMHIIGHSQGGVVVPAFFASNHSYDDKIGHYIGMAPGLIYGDDMDPLLKFVFRLFPRFFESLPKFLFEIVAQTRIAGAYHSPIARKLYPFCNFFPSVCAFAFNFVSQRNFVNKLTYGQNFRLERFTVRVTATPGGFTPMAFYAVTVQSFKKGKPGTKLDYRRIPHIELANLEMYNSTEPPEIDLTQARLNTSLIFVTNDIFTGIDTARGIIEWLKPTDSLIIDDPRFTHDDLASSPQAPCMVFEFLLKKFTGSDDARGEAYVRYRHLVAQHKKNLPEPPCAKRNITQST